MTHVKYFAPGTRGGGEHGAGRAGRADRTPPRWIADDAARARLAALTLPLRDRFLVDLLSTKGIRVGEALSLFTADLHFGAAVVSSGAHCETRIFTSAPTIRWRITREPKADHGRYSFTAISSRAMSTTR
jgi:hypothetical protein